ncbi:MAG TPA: pectate lyase [Bryobacteraceae bacterium]|nr:pectate lyase [Bryobacteraceae bacterium]
MKRLALILISALPLVAQTPEDVRTALRKAVAFFVTSVSPHGGYHYYYTADLSYGRSEHSEGLNTSENQREATPLAGMTFLEAYEATGDSFYLDAARRTAVALTKGQHCSGGWDYTIEFDPAKRKAHPYRVDNNCAAAERPAGATAWSQPYTTLDDNTTQACLRFLMRTDKALGFKDATIHEAVTYALAKLSEAQYPNGAWPQRFFRRPDASKFPVRKASYPETWSREWPGPSYQNLYTFNDNVISDCIDLFLEAARIYNDPRYRAIAEKGGEFILLAQMPDPQPAWAQQYNLDMHPAWARVFEPPSVTGGESQGILKTLLVLYQETGNRKYLDVVPRALEYLKSSVVKEVQDKGARSRIPTGAPALARFYELKTNRPLYITKGTRVNVDGRFAANLDGYKLDYKGDSVITHYNVVVSGASLAKLEAEYKRLLDADPASIRRPDKLHGLSPWAEYPENPAAQAQFPSRSSQYGGAERRETMDRPRKPSRDEVRQILNAMDDRGAWVETGSIGRADRIVSVLAAQDMVVKIGGATYPLKEDQTLEIFRGQQPPPKKIISTSTFAWNVESLAGFLTADTRRR